MVNPLKVLEREIHDVANGDLHIGTNVAAPEVTEASSKEALEAYRVYSTQKNLLADRVNFVKSIIDKFAGILLGASATFFGVFLGSSRGNASGIEALSLTNEQLGQRNQYVEEQLADIGIDENAPTYDTVVSRLESDFPNENKHLLTDEQLETLEAAADTGQSETLMMGGLVILGSLALSGVSLLFQQFVTRQLTDKGAYTNDYYRKAQAEEIAKEVEPVMDRQASKHLVSGESINWEGLMDPEALRAVQADETRIH